MADSIYKWSLTASSNDAVDSIINWRENQLPDTVNDSARGMMKRLAELREDLTGGLVTAGTQPAYTVTTNAAFDTLANGRFITVRVHATNAGGAGTINVNALGAKAIRKFGTSGDLPLGVGDLQLNGLYQFMYSTAANAGAGGWIVSNPSIGTGGGFASGTSMLFMNVNAPVGWTKATTHDNKALRIVTGATGGSAGGTTAFSTVFASKTPTGTVGGHVLTWGETGAHYHNQQGTFNTGTVSADHTHYTTTGTESADHTHGYTVLNQSQASIFPGGSYGTAATPGNGSYNTGGRSAAHTHAGSSGGISANHYHAVTLSSNTDYQPGNGTTTAHVHPWTGNAMDFAVQYVDSIICTKD